MVNIPGFPKDAPKILAMDDAQFFHEAYLESFVDINSDYYQKYVITPSAREGKLAYGYLWECLRNTNKITHQRLCSELSQFAEILVMAEPYDYERGAYPIWPFPPRSVVQFKPQIFLNALPVLPEDLYIFDSSICWTLVQTHEYDDKRRYCLAVGVAT